MGFSRSDLLEKEGAQYIIDTPDEFIKIINKINSCN